MVNGIYNSEPSEVPIGFTTMCVILSIILTLNVCKKSRIF